MKTKKKWIVAVLIAISIIAASILPAQAANGNNGAFKTLRIGKVDLTSEINSQMVFYNSNDDQMIEVAENKLNRIQVPHLLYPIFYHF